MSIDANKPELTITDVFKNSKRALTDGVMVTPTLIGGGPAGRLIMIGDLTDIIKLRLLLDTLAVANIHG